MSSTTAFADIIARFRSCQSGATSIEYALIASFIGMVIVGTVTTIGGNLDSVFADVSAGFN
mgnify:CR=1 FL=1